MRIDRTECVLCEQHLERDQHLFRDCPTVRNAWLALGRSTDFLNPLTDFETWIERNVKIPKEEFRRWTRHQGKASSVLPFGQFGLEETIGFLEGSLMSIGQIR